MNLPPVSTLLYRVILRMHPRAFRDRFADEMLWIFKEECRRGAAGRVIADGLLSLARQQVKSYEMLRPAASTCCAASNHGISPQRFLEAALVTSLIFNGFLFMMSATATIFPPYTHSISASGTPSQHQSTLRQILRAVPTVSSALQPHHVYARSNDTPTQAAEQEKQFDASGTWQGVITAPQEYRCVVKIAKAEDGTLKALFYNIDRKGDPLPLTTVVSRESELEFTLGSMNASFAGRATSDGKTINGKWAQYGASRTLTLERATPATAWRLPSPAPRPRVHPNDEQPTHVAATIRRSDTWMQGGGFRVSDYALEAVNQTLRSMIEFSYEIQASQIINLPEWATTHKFDITMPFDNGDYPNDARCKAMVRKVLADQFGLKLQREKKEAPIYALVTAAGGPHLTKSVGDANGLPRLYTNAPGYLGASNATMADLAGELQRNVLDRPVVDRTGLSGRWDFGLDWTPDEAQLKAHPTEVLPNRGKENLSASLQRLGLRLEAIQAESIEFVIEQVQDPLEPDSETTVTHPFQL